MMSIYPATLYDECARKARVALLTGTAAGSASTAPPSPRGPSCGRHSALSSGPRTRLGRPVATLQDGRTHDREWVVGAQAGSQHTCPAMANLCWPSGSGPPRSSSARLLVRSAPAPSALRGRAWWRDNSGWHTRRHSRPVSSAGLGRREDVLGNPPGCPRSAAL